MLDWKIWIKNWLRRIMHAMEIQLINSIYISCDIFPILSLIPWALWSGTVKYFQLICVLQYFPAGPVNEGSH